ncbi:MAG TPA: methyltransferase domain-containing protein [Terriglobales bacterium]|nr:methyltransferase domain-containing protein [Terriglobales bacterium]
MERVVIPELLDTDDGSPEEVAESLADIGWVNRWFGGVATACSMIEHVSRKSGKQHLSILEVAAGTGDTPAAARQRMQRKGIHLDITLLDRAKTHLNHGNRSVVADALALPFADESYDLISCSLFAHHLSPAEIVQFVSEGLRICRIAVLINDLVRDPIHLALAYAGRAFYRSRLSKHDGPVSVRKSYTLPEMRELLGKTLAARVEVTPHYMYRMAAIAWKKAK